MHIKSKWCFVSPCTVYCTHQIQMKIMWTAITVISFRFSNQSILSLKMSEMIYQYEIFFFWINWLVFAEFRLDHQKDRWLRHLSSKRRHHYLNTLNENLVSRWISQHTAQPDSVPILHPAMTTAVSNYKKSKFNVTYITRFSPAIAVHSITCNTRERSLFNNN